MNCSQAQELLSPYYDGELTADERETVGRHLRDCAQCSVDLTNFQKLSALAAQTCVPEPPTELWTRLEVQLEEIIDRPTVTKVSRRTMMQFAALAVLLLVAIGTGLWAHWLRTESNVPPELAIDLDGFLDDFRRDPQRAAKIFVARYDGREAGLDEALKTVRYPIAASQLPPGFSLDAVYLLKMECCTGIQTVYKRKGSQVLAILQHTIDQPVWYGNRTVEIAQVHGKPTRIVRVNGHLAATWQANGTYVTVIGARNMAELTNLIIYLEHNTKEN